MVSESVELRGMGDLHTWSRVWGVFARHLGLDGGGS